MLWVARRNKPPWAEMDKDNGLLNGKFSFKGLSDGSLHKNKIIYIYCPCELSHHWSTSRLKYHMLAKHTADAETPPPPHQRQTTQDSLQQRRLNNSTYNKLSKAIAKWMAAACRPINKCKVWHYIVLVLLTNDLFRPSVAACLTWVPFYAFSIFFEHAVPSREYSGQYLSLFLIVFIILNIHFRKQAYTSTPMLIRVLKI